MLTRQDIPKLLLSGLKTEFQKGYTWVPSLYTEVTTEVPSGKTEEIYAWLGDNPQLREWKDEKMPKTLLEHGFTITNKDYEATIAVDRNALKDDQYGQIKIRAMNLWMTSKKGYDRALTELIEAWHTDVCYDGQNFFDTDHSEGTSGTQSNYSSSGKSLSSASVKEIISTMRQYKSDTGEYVWVNPTHIMVPTGLEFTAKELFDPSFVNVTTDPSKATLRWLLKVIVNPYLANNWTVANSAYYIMDLTGVVKPFIFQNREAMKFVPLDKDTDYESFMRKTLYYSAEARFAFGYGDWRFVFKAQG